MFKSLHKSVKFFDILSTHSIGVNPFFSAASCIFCPCSSTPVRKLTSFPLSLSYLARTSATIVVYAVPTCGAALG